jgi:hypothetical protein
MNLILKIFIRNLFVLDRAELLNIFRSFVFELVVGKINNIILMGKLLGVMIELGKLMGYKIAQK